MRVALTATGHMPSASHYPNGRISYPQRNRFVPLAEQHQFKAGAAKNVTPGHHWI